MNLTDTFQVIGEKIPGHGGWGVWEYAEGFTHRLIHRLRMGGIIITAVQRSGPDGVMCVLLAKLSNNEIRKLRAAKREGGQPPDTSPEGLAKFRAPRPLDMHYLRGL